MSLPNTETTAATRSGLFLPPNISCLAITVFPQTTAGRGASFRATTSMAKRSLCSGRPRRSELSADLLLNCSAELPGNPQHQAADQAYQQACDNGEIEGCALSPPHNISRQPAQ